MTLEDDPLEHERASWKPSPGLAVAVPDPVRDPELPPHRARMTDKDPAAMTRAVRTVYTLFYLSVAASIWAIAAYFLFPIERRLDRRDPRQQPLHRPRHRPRPARHRHRCDPLVEGDHVRQGVRRAPSRDPRA